MKDRKIKVGQFYTKQTVLSHIESLNKRVRQFDRDQSIAMLANGLLSLTLWFGAINYP